ncbi:MAG: hypothetical protein IJ640_00045 [Prevotella sp.]|nr:hypothetical protein [Prevotella sp.]
MFNNETRQQLSKLFRANADKQLSISKVLETTIAALRQDKTGLGGLYADIVGESRSEERKNFLAVFAQHMPHVVFNGTDKVVMVDWVEAKEDSNLNKAIRQYRLAGGNIVRPEVCVGVVETEQEVKKQEKVTLASGYEMMVVSRDAEGTILTETKKLRLVPREKSVWGYTDTVMNAFIEAIEEIAG